MISIMDLHVMVILCISLTINVGLFCERGLLVRLDSDRLALGSDL